MYFVSNKHYLKLLCLHVNFDCCKFQVLIAYFIGMSVTLSGQDSYITLSVNSHLLVLGDQGLLTIRSIDNNGIIYSSQWTTPSHYLTIELYNGTLYLRAAVSGGMYYAYVHVHYVQYNVCGQMFKLQFF